MVSMTGFGTSEFCAGGARYRCTVRSVNRKALELTLRTPPELIAIEPAIRALVQDVCARGEVALAVDRERGGGGLRAEVDEEAARVLHAAYVRVAAAIGSDAPVPLALVVGSPEVVRLVRDGGPAEDCTEAVMAGVRAAVSALDAMRRREGEALEREISSRMEVVRERIGQVRSAAAAASAALMERAAARARAIAAGAQVDLDPAALASALVSMADKADVCEELARLDAHAVRMAEVLASPPPHGRRIDFLCQEMMREIGTLAAKAQSTAVSHQAVEIKSEIERIREQTANVL